MKKLYFFLLLFIYFAAKPEQISLANNATTLYAYAKPYIYVIEKNRYSRIKIPEMTLSEPVYFKFTDSTFSRKFIPVSYGLFEIDKRLYLSHHLGGEVYEMKDNLLVRIDQSYEHKMQINSADFVYDNRIFRFGGYGFWSARNFFTYFDLKSKEWEIYSPVQGKNFPPGLFDVNLYQNGENLYLFNGVTTNELDYLKLEKSQDFWQFNLRTKTWKKRGKTSLFFGNNTKNFRDKNNYFAFTEERRILRINFDTNTYDTFQNEAFSTKIFERFQPVVENDILYYFNHNHATVSIDLLAVPLADFLGEPQSSANFLETDYWEEYGMLFISGLVLFLISLLIYFLLLLNPKKANYITDKDGILYLGKAAINFEETELIVLKYLLKNNDVPNSELLGLVEQKGVHFSHNIRLKNDLLNQLNLKLKAILQVDVNFIIFKKSDTDSRLKVYRLNKQYFRVSEAFLNS